VRAGVRSPNEFSAGHQHCLSPSSPSARIDSPLRTTFGAAARFGGVTRGALRLGRAVLQRNVTN
jgi:hypothetical protein